MTKKTADKTVRKKSAKKATTKKNKKSKKKAKKKSAKTTGKAIKASSRKVQAEVVQMDEMSYDERIRQYGLEDLNSKKVTAKMDPNDLNDWFDSLHEREADRTPFKKELSKYGNGEAADRMILKLKSEGKTDKECAMELGVNRRTIMVWREQHITFSYSYAHGIYLYYRGLGQRMINALREGKSLVQFASSEGIPRSKIYDLEKANKKFAEAKQLAMEAAQAYWEDLAHDAASGALTGMYDSEYMTYQGKPILDPKTGKPLPKRKVHNKPYSERLIMYQMAARFEDYKLKQQDEDNSLESAWQDVIERYNNDQAKLAGSGKV